MTDQNASTFLFDDVRVEPVTFRAFKAGSVLQLEPKTLRLLIFLIENHSRLIEKEEILNTIWPGVHVTENALVREVGKLRKTLGDDPKEPKYIQTVHTRGYRFIAEIEIRNGAERLLPVTTKDSHAGAPMPEERKGSGGAASEAQAGSSRKHLWLLWILIIAFAAAILIGWRVYRSSTSTATSLPVAIRQITSWPGLDCNPAFSPDAESIVYSSDHTGSFEIYVKSLAPGAKEIQLTTDGQQNFDPAWSPDGNRIAYYSMKRHGVLTMTAFGGVAKQLTDFGSHPVWSRDGRWLAFQSVSSPDLGSVPMGASTIWIVSAEGGTPKQITRNESPSGSHFAPAWSPD